MQDIRQNMERVKDALRIGSANKMSVEYDVIPIRSLLTSLSYSEEDGYHVAPENIKDLIDDYISKKEYDYIFVVVKFTNSMVDTTVSKGNDWVGLGGMDYYGIGFSNIRLPEDENSYLYKYDSRHNIFPEEVYVHEFLHTLERNAKESGYTIPELHDYEKYGYENNGLSGQSKWYADYMTKNIKSKGELIGLPAQVYKSRPVHESNFTYSMNIELYKKPENIIEEIIEIFKAAFTNITYIQKVVVNGSAELISSF